MSFDTWARSQPDRCSGCGFHLAVQGCRCEANEWDRFKDALHRARRADGTIHQTDVRPLIQSIPSKHRGLLWRRARSTGYVVEVGHERSDDTAGGNAGRMEPVYRLAS